MSTPQYLRPWTRRAQGGRGLWVLAHHAQAQAEAGLEEDDPPHDHCGDHHKEADGLLGQNGADDGDGGKEVQGGGDGGHLGGGALVVPDELHQQGGDGQSQQVQSDAADDLVDLVAHGQDAVEQAVTMPPTMPSRKPKSTLPVK